MKPQMDTREIQEPMPKKANMLDPAVCVLTGGAFLEGRAFKPSDRLAARIEGWIWVVDNALCLQPGR